MQWNKAHSKVITEKRNRNNNSNRVTYWKVICIPKIKLVSSGNDFIQFKRWQFPIKLAFAMTTNKAQGQTLDGRCCAIKSQISKINQNFIMHKSYFNF